MKLKNIIIYSTLIFASTFALFKFSQRHLRHSLTQSLDQNSQQLSNPIFSFQSEAAISKSRSARLRDTDFSTQRRKGAKTLRFLCYVAISTISISRSAGLRDTDFLTQRRKGAKTLRFLCYVPISTISISRSAGLGDTNFSTQRRQGAKVFVLCS